MTLTEALRAGDVLAVARHYRNAGLSVIPVWADGSKAPRVAAWTRYADTPPSEAELVEWFGRGPSGGLGVPGGPASGNLSVLDFETAEIWSEWLARVPASLREHVEACPLARTPGGGAHLYVRLDHPTKGVTLAERPGGTDDRGRPRTRTLIETRAHGGQVLAPGCPPECHPLRRPYTWERAAWVDGGPNHVVPVEVWVEWLELAAGLTQVERKRAEPKPDTRPRGASSADDPGTDFNHRGTWAETGLFAAGWELARDYGDDRGLVRRPGKKVGVSGSLGVCSSAANHWPLFHCFTSSAAPFEPGGNYDRFGVYTRLEHGGDFKAAAHALRERGYGKRDAPDPPLTWGAPPPPDGATGRGFKWASELTAPDRADDWVWEGYLPRGAVTLLSALWKVGKTTLLAHLLKACGQGGTFLGKPLKASKVLYISEEGERHWVRRRDALGLTNKVGFYVQPFPTRPAQAGWLAFVEQLKRDVETHGFDLVVFDTLAKLWPVQEENDAGAVDAALMPLWRVARAGAGILLIHHLRKSGGQEYTGSRGSGALSAFPDILVEMTRFDASDAKDRKRVLRAKGRYEETPDELVIELVGGEYVAVPELSVSPPTDPALIWAPPAERGSVASREEQRIVDVLGTSAQVWLQAEDIRAALRARNWGMRNEDISTHLASLYSRQQVVMRGRLRSKNQPREYALASRSAPGSRGGETNGDEMPT
ncbi:AAA family ATPase [Frigoriglobus tundricola]|uniref:DNA primase/polymerase bifunctional N-terminal domain-containing protein n=1 Tax=Frigoriglobus tundricola TaxID=2774151 RepID=A0A6M5YXB7_9BACT|nr:AAA family ATPase [Frigoriglobus tundricola]QJW98615.1 hypothetical protein FTUN_6210 [Frigoriglobus tundricola]